ncbi:FKBP-type peptidyl-prolyl cis-trans isomerase [Candidatus Saccharibacteria bacterium]|nr:FKBP-type peptidyl-prolyl cis-trans isomerase [Candidatus Saccharibacteria bacterium]
MASKKEGAKRVAILIAVGGMIFSSVGLTIVALTQQNSADPAQTQQEQLQKQIQEQLKQQKEAQVPKDPLPGYEATSFDPASVTELKVETLKQGEGPSATSDSTVSANYFGWTSDGKIFDSTNKGGTVTPIDFPLSGVISGWTEGLTGVKQGSVVKITIPAEKAYGATDNGDGRPFGPLVFIVELTEVK